MFKFVIQFLLIYLFWNSNRKSKGGILTPSGVILGIYLICSACGIADLYIDDFSQPFESRYWGPMFLFVFTLMFFLFPFRFFDETRIQKVMLPNKSVLDIFSSVIIVLSLYAIFYYSSTVRMLFSGNLNSARQELYMGTEYVEAGLANTIASVSSSLYVFALLLFFVYSAIGTSRWRRILLIISSLSEPLHVLAYVGRDGVVFWLFAFALLYAFFKNFMPEKAQKSIKKTFLINGSVLLVPFIAISISRFASSDVGTRGAIISYLGQSFVHGPLYFGLDQHAISNGSSFGLFCNILGITPKPSEGLTQIGDWKSWCFGTFATGFYSNFGFWGMMLVGLFSLLFFWLVFKDRKYSLSFAHFFIYILYFQVYAQGAFYFRHYTRGGNLFILLCPIMFLIFVLLGNGGTILNRQRT